jgi:quercetin dioxygenase-like cupin family protein
MQNRRTLLTALAAASVGLAEPKKVESKTVHTQPLPEPFSGWEARFAEVRIPAGLPSTPHHHPGFVLGYVLDGEFRFAINGEPPKVLPAGQAFYEPPGATHTTGESASHSRPARILAIIVAPAGKQ